MRGPIVPSLARSNHILAHLPCRARGLVLLRGSRFRCHSSAATTTTTTSTSSAAGSIREAFDSPFSYQHATTTSGSASRCGRPSTGRFRYDALRQPSDLLALSEKTQRRAGAIVQRILAYSPTAAGPSNPKNLELDLLVQVKQIDRLSDLLCSLIDLTELIRNIDEDPEWREHADRVYLELCYFMNELNVHVGLYEALKKVYTPLASTIDSSPSETSSSIRSQLFPALTVASQFLLDFEKSGIHLPRKQRARFVTLSDEILSLGRDFTNPPAERSPDDDPEGSLVPITADELSAIGWSDPSSSSGTSYLPVETPQAQTIRREHPSESVRRRFYEATYRRSDRRVSILEDLLKKRQELASLVGKQSWSEVALVDKMAKTPENVMSFLTSLSEHNRPLAQQDLAYLRQAKRDHLNLAPKSVADLSAWDWDFYFSRGLALRSPSAPSPSAISQYLSIGTCIAGLSTLFSKIYGIHFEVVPLQPGETWNNADVKRLDVIDERHGKIGEIYCDLYARNGKPNGAAHFTVRCSRRVDDDLAHHDLEFLGSDEGLSPDEPSTFPLHSDQAMRRIGDETHQLPIVVLTCEFDRPSVKKGPGLLSWHEVEVLFHEMGHAMHSMIGRTDYHNVAGTRCATDLVELPSILMEHFVSSPEVLKTFAFHHSSLTPMPEHLMRQLIDNHKVFSALESNAQIMMAILDQHYHANLEREQGASSAGIDSTAIYQHVASRYAAVPPAPGAAWQAHFGHLFSYGATYYSYLFDRAIASKIYHKLFAADPLSREAGEVYKDELLRFGGGKDPWTCVGNTLGGREREILAKGDKRSMDLVGSWNVD